jgi:hypothetical protein
VLPRDAIRPSVMYVCEPHGPLMAIDVATFVACVAVIIGRAALLHDCLPALLRRCSGDGYVDREGVSDLEFFWMSRDRHHSTFEVANAVNVPHNALFTALREWRVMDMVP